MAEREDGGPAFPVVANNNVYATGMTLRDWLAGQALMGMAAGEGIDVGTYSSDEKRAAHAYKIADDMLAARKESE